MNIFRGFAFLAVLLIAMPMIAAESGKIDKYLNLLVYYDQETNEPVLGVKYFWCYESPHAGAGEKILEQRQDKSRLMVEYANALKASINGIFTTNSADNTTPTTLQVHYEHMCSYVWHSPLNLPPDSLLPSLPPDPGNITYGMILQGETDQRVENRDLSLGGYLVLSPNTHQGGPTFLLPSVIGTLERVVSHLAPDADKGIIVNDEFTRIRLEGNWRIDDILPKRFVLHANYLFTDTLDSKNLFMETHWYDVALHYSLSETQPMRFPYFHEVFIQYEHGERPPILTKENRLIAGVMFVLP